MKTVTIWIDQSTLTNGNWSEKTKRASVKILPNHEHLYKDGSIAVTPYIGDVFDPRFDCRSLREAIGLMKKYYKVTKELSKDRVWHKFEAIRI